MALDDEFRIRRPLTPGEHEMIRGVFGFELTKLDRVRVVDKPYWSPIFLLADDTTYRPHALGRRVFFPNTSNGNYYAPDYSKTSVDLHLRSIFIHEMTHVWQDQVGPSKYTNKSRKTLKSMSETDPYISTGTLDQVSLEDIFAEAAKAAAAQLEGKTHIPDRPAGSVVRASEHYAASFKAQGSDIDTAEEVRALWQSNIDYNYLMPSEFHISFYDLSQEQQAKMVQDYYFVRESQAQGALSNKSSVPSGVTWRKRLPLSFYKAFIPFVPK